MGGAVLQVSVALAAILAMVFLAAWLFRRVGGTRLSGRGVIHVVATTPIGARERLMLVEVHGQQMLLGVTATQVTALTSFGADAPKVEVAGNEFRAALKSWMNRP